MYVHKFICRNDFSVLTCDWHSWSASVVSPFNVGWHCRPLVPRWTSRDPGGSGRPRRAGRSGKPSARSGRNCPLEVTILHYGQQYLVLLIAEHVPGTATTPAAPQLQLVVFWLCLSFKLMLAAVSHCDRLPYDLGTSTWECTVTCTALSSNILAGFPIE